MPLTFFAGTEHCQLIPATVGKTKTLLIDTPGFDDTKRSDSEILAEISKVLAAQYELGIKLKGVIYLHRISDVRYSGASVKTFQIFKKICGEKALNNVMLVTTRWSDEEESLGAKREQQLRTEFWAYMLHNGSTMARFYGDRDSAVAMASQLLSKQTIVLELQREIVEEKKQLKDTTAGALVNDELAEMKAKYQEELREIEELKQTLRDEDRAMKLQIQRDWEREQQRLRQAQDDSVILRSNVGNEVRQQIDQKKKRHGFSTVLSFLPHVLSVLGLFVGIPPGATSILTSWFDGSDFGDSIAEIFDNF